MRAEYHESAIVWEDGPFACRFRRAESVLCSDGMRRNAQPSGSGIADTFFSIPARVSVGGKTVTGYITVESMGGYSVTMPDDPPTVKFIAYSYGRNGHLLPGLAWRAGHAI